MRPEAVPTGLKPKTPPSTSGCERASLPSRTRTVTGFASLTRRDRRRRGRPRCACAGRSSWRHRLWAIFLSGACGMTSWGRVARPRFFSGHRGRSGYPRLPLRGAAGRRQEDGGQGVCLCDALRRRWVRCVRRLRAREARLPSRRETSSVPKALRATLPQVRDIIHDVNLAPVEGSRKIYIIGGRCLQRIGGQRIPQDARGAAGRRRDHPACALLRLRHSHHRVTLSGRALQAHSARRCRPPCSSHDRAQMLRRLRRLLRPREE